MRVLITGITGQDGSYLAELLLDEGHEVHGLVRRVAHQSQNFRTERINHIVESITLHPGAVENLASVYKVIEAVKPEQCYHLAAQSFVAQSFADEFTTMDININGTHNMLSAIRDIVPECKFYFAATSEMFGNSKESPQNEETPLSPASPYGISKVAGYELMKHYREAWGMKCYGGICFNHESPRRGQEFVTRKVTSTVAKIKLGMADKLELGHLSASRDWGHAQDYVRAMYMMLQGEPDDYVVSTGISHTVMELADVAFDCVGLTASDYVRVNKNLYRPKDVTSLVGDSTKIRTKLGWKPQVLFEEMIKEMVEHDLCYHSRL